MLKEHTINVHLYNGDVFVTNPRTQNTQAYKIIHYSPGKNLIPKDIQRNKRLVQINYAPQGARMRFKTFATLDPFGVAQLDERFADPKHGDYFEKHLNILLDPYTYQEKYGLVYSSTTTCRRCGRQLTDDDSVLTGIGPKCIEHWGMKEDSRRIKKLDDGARFGELRSFAQQQDFLRAYLALGFIEQDELRTHARLYLRDLDRRRQAQPFKHSA